MITETAQTRNQTTIQTVRYGPVTQSKAYTSSRKHQGDAACTLLPYNTKTPHCHESGDIQSPKCLNMAPETTKGGTRHPTQPYQAQKLWKLQGVGYSVQGNDRQQQHNSTDKHRKAQHTKGRQKKANRSPANAVKTAGKLSVLLSTLLIFQKRQ